MFIELPNETRINTAHISTYYIKYNESNNIYTLHIKKLSPHYESDRRKILNRRLSNKNVQNRWGYHYSYNDLDEIKKEYEDPNIVDIKATYGI